ncbi:elc1 Elongin-C [Candida maltosa Xu316]
MSSPEKEYVTLVSSDNFKFVILKEVASISSVLRNSQGFEEGQTKKVKLDMDGDILECIVEYLYYHYKYKDAVAEGRDIPEFNIPTHLALELLVKADYLDI